jgi:hypothetical protein
MRSCSLRFMITCVSRVAMLSAVLAAGCALEVPEDTAEQAGREERSEHGIVIGSRAGRSDIVIGSQPRHSDIVIGSRHRPPSAQTMPAQRSR